MIYRMAWTHRTISLDVMSWLLCWLCLWLEYRSSSRDWAALKLDSIFMKSEWARLGFWWFSGRRLISSLSDWSNLAFFEHQVQKTAINQQFGSGFASLNYLQEHAGTAWVSQLDYMRFEGFLWRRIFYPNPALESLSLGFMKKTFAEDRIFKDMREESPKNFLGIDQRYILKQT